MVIDGPKVTLTCGSARFSLQTMPVEDYPTLPQMPEARGTVGSAAVLARRRPGGHGGRAATTCCRCSPVCGVELDGDSIAMLATDRFRLSQRELTWSPRCSRHRRGRAGAGQGARRHGQGAGRRHRDLDRPLLPGSRGGAGEGIIGFEGSAGGGVRRTTTRLLDGDFPKVRSLFPSEHLTVARVDKAALVDSVKRVSLVAERNTAVQLAFTDGVLTLDAGSGEEAMASESLEANVTGEDITTGFNPAYLLDGLTAIEAPFVELAFTQASQARRTLGCGLPRGRRGQPTSATCLMPRRLLS